MGIARRLVIRVRLRLGSLSSLSSRQLARQLRPVVIIHFYAEVDRQVTDMATNSNHRLSPDHLGGMLPRAEQAGQPAQILVIT